MKRNQLTKLKLSYFIPLSLVGACTGQFVAGTGSSAAAPPPGQNYQAQPPVQWIGPQPSTDRNAPTPLLLGTTIGGAIGPGTDYYYMLDLQEGQGVDILSYTRTITKGYGYFTVQVLEPDDVKLCFSRNNTRVSDSWSRKRKSCNVKANGSHLIKISGGASARIEYKMQFYNPDLGTPSAL